MGRVYFGHPINTFDTDLESSLIGSIRKRFEGCELINPNTEVHIQGYRQRGLPYLLWLARTCDEGVFLSFPDGTWATSVLAQAKSMFGVYAPIWVITHRGNIMEVRNIHGVRGLGLQESKERIL